METVGVLKFNTPFFLPDVELWNRSLLQLWRLPWLSLLDALWLYGWLLSLVLFLEQNCHLCRIVRKYGSSYLRQFRYLCLSRKWKPDRYSAIFFKQVWPDGPYGGCWFRLWLRVAYPHVRFKQAAHVGGIHARGYPPFPEVEVQVYHCWYAKLSHTTIWFGNFNSSYWRRSILSTINAVSYLLLMFL